MPHHTDKLSPPGSVGLTRASSNSSYDTAQPPLTSGFGAVIEKEHRLQIATAGTVGSVRGNHASDVDRILRHHHIRVGANIALLEQRYESLPAPQRFVVWHGRRHPASVARHGEGDSLAGLIARHSDLVSDINTLIQRAPDGQRGELILTEVGRNHEEMAWMLAALLKEDETNSRLANPSNVPARVSVSRAQEVWDNEGGSPPVGPSTVPTLHGDAMGGAR